MGDTIWELASSIFRDGFFSIFFIWDFFSYRRRFMQHTVVHVRYGQSAAKYLRLWNEPNIPNLLYGTMFEAALKWYRTHYT